MPVPFRPIGAIAIPTPAQYLRLDECVFDGGWAGWEEAGIIADRLDTYRMERLSLIRGSDIDLASGSDGLLHVGSETFSGAIET